MKAARWHAKGDIRVEDVPEPKAGRDEVVIKVKRCGICGTDLHEYTDGPQVIRVGSPHPLTGHMPPIIMGHEIAGDIVELGPDVEGFSIGDRVVVMPLNHCGKCYYCRRGLEHLCKIFGSMGLQWYWGGFAEYCMVKDYQVIKIPDEMTYEQAACVEPLALALYGIGRANQKVSDDVLITGGGPTGVFTLMGCRAAGAGKVFVTEVLEHRAQRCMEFGADAVYNPTVDDVFSEIRKQTDDYGVDVAYECTGNENAMQDCVSILKKRGMYVQSGLSIGKASFDTFNVAFKDLNMVGLWCYNSYDFPSTISQIVNGACPVEKSVTKVIGLDEIVPEGFDTLTKDKQGKETKIQVSFE
ncbi:MAG: 2,3-butanediol dehydrogenase [Christensenellales bacterium]|jgi:(R,R)-butanediol dehydrogenase/meso-butanediol dehydrogenase/diacetyl reductase